MRIDTNLHWYLSRWLALLIGGSLVAFAGGLWFSTEVPAKPAIMWNPASINRAVPLGEMVTIPVSFTATESIENAIVEVVPELSQILEVRIFNIGDVSPGETLNVDIVITTPESMAARQFEGTIKLRSQDNPERVFARPLPIVIDVAEYVNDLLGFSLEVPEGFTIKPEEQSTNASTFGLTGITSEQSIGITVQQDNPSHLSLEEWADTRDWGFEDDWRNHFTQIQLNAVSLLYDFDTCSAILTNEDLIYRFSNGIGFEPCTVDDLLFDSVLNSLEFNN